MSETVFQPPRVAPLWAVARKGHFDIIGAKDRLMKNEPQ